MEIHVVKAKIRKNSNLKLNLINPMQNQRVRGHLDGHIGYALFNHPR
ncbi:unannotated protein [freshwater metagenome]|uniref:Unannotated protein n=1 Tax=freshwater metagenome TaxID=449393 RepID=A0A6J6CH78_9ZZZZ